MTSSSSVATETKMKSRGGFRKRLVGSLNKKKEEKRDDVTTDVEPLAHSANGPASDSLAPSEEGELRDSRGERKQDGSLSESKGDPNEAEQIQESPSEEAPEAKDEAKPKKRRGEGFVRRMRSLSRSRSGSASRKKNKDGEERRTETIATVTSSRSDGYYNQKAPGSTSKLPRKAPSNLKLFHELAVGIKDAYAAVGQTPVKPLTEEEGGEKMSKQEFYARAVLWEFIGNIDFLLALVDEVAVDTATRGALKDDTTFKGLRDVIKKCNKVLEDMLVRRERRYTLYFRLVQPGDAKEIERIKLWNDKVEKAVGAVTDQPSESETESSMDADSDTSSLPASDSSTSSKSVFSRGRQLLPVAGRVRARRATPTPRLRKQKNSKKSDEESQNAAEDGFSAVNTPVTQGNLAMLQKSLGNAENKGPMPNGLNIGGAVSDPKQLSQGQQMQPKDELVDVIRGLRYEKMKNREGTAESDLTTLKPDWRPKADIPSAVPKLPIEYIHRHRLMKQVVSCLLEQTGAGPRDVDEDYSGNKVITSITSRHGDKAGNGKTILAVAAIQTVEVRERFSDGIAWLQLGRGPLNERDIRRLYEELYRQVIIKDSDIEDESDDGSSAPADKDDGPSGGQNTDGSAERKEAEKDDTRKQRLAELAESRRRFQGGDIEGIKEDLGRLLNKKKVLICLDDVWRVEDAKWFIFDNQILNGTKQQVRKGTSSVEINPCRILMTTRTPSLLGSGLVNEVFVRILSEHEAVKLLLSTSGRRPYGGKNSTVFNQAKLIVKGCGNSPLAVRLAGSMLRQSSRSWNISSPAWSSLIHQCRLNLEEASQLRSFVNAVNRVVDLSFFTVSDVRTRVALRRCFVAFAMAFRHNDWMLSGKGIPQSVVLRLFRSIIASQSGSKEISAGYLLSLLEKLNLIERARHGCSSRAALRATETPSANRDQREGSDKSDSDWDDTDEPTVRSGIQKLFVMHDSLKAVAEEMAGRATLTLSPDADDFTSYLGKIEEEGKIREEASSAWAAPMRFFAQQLVVIGSNSQSNENKSQSHGFHEVEAHKILVTSLLQIGDGAERNVSVSDALRAGQLDVAASSGGDKMEEYIAAFLPAHLMRCNAFTSAAEVLYDEDFIARRVSSLGIVEATSRHVGDLQELRRLAGGLTFSFSTKRTDQKTGQAGGSPHGSPIATSPTESNDHAETDATEPATAKFDVNGVVRDASRIMIDEVYHVANKAEGSSDSLGMAMCLAAVGEGLLRARQPRDAMLRLEEAVGIYRGLLGQWHTNVADALHSVAKALVKLGETRVALLKFAEAARIYESCDATLHYNSIANAQSLASLLVDLGDMEKAQSMFEEVISMRKRVYGVKCVPVAKTINAYAILLAKHGRMDLALKNYEEAKQTYETVSPQLIHDPDFDIKCRYDVTLINLNIASIRSKKGDLRDAIACYEDGVRGLREYEAAQAELHKDLRATDSSKNTAHKHLVAALGRIGSLKLKIGDNEGALVAYMTLLREVKEDSPAASQTEKAKAHIKCATIYRQQEGDESHSQSISHLREALAMYTAIFGPDHKDTAAIASSLRQWLSEDRGEA